MPRRPPHLACALLVALCSLAIPGTAGAISADPTSVDFGSVPVGSTATQSVTVTLDSGYSLGGVSFPPPFDVDTDTCRGFVGPGTCNVKVTFAPTAGGPAAGNLGLAECPVSGGCITVDVPLSGNGGSSLPEAAIGDLRQLVAGLGIQHGMANALDSKLAAALAALQAADNAGACDTLHAFLNQVRAQSGKKLSLAQAEELTAAAESIRAGLGC